MKILPIIGFGLLLGSLTGCMIAPLPSEAVDSTPSASVDSQLVGAPTWVTAPDTTGTYVVAGTYSAHAGPDSYQHKMAWAVGCDKLAVSLHQQLELWLQSETQQTDLKADDTQSLVREITARCIRQAREEARWQTADNTLYIKISIDSTQVKDVAIEAYIKFLKARPNLWKLTVGQRTETDLISALQATADHSLSPK